MQKIRIFSLAIVISFLGMGCVTNQPNACLPRCAAREMQLWLNGQAVQSRILLIRFLDGDRSRTHAYLIFQRRTGNWHAYDPEVGSYPVQYHLDPLLVAKQLKHETLIINSWWE